VVTSVRIRSNLKKGMTVNRIDRNRLMVGIRKYMLSEIDSDLFESEYLCMSSDDMLVREMAYSINMFLSDYVSHKCTTKQYEILYRFSALLNSNYELQSSYVPRIYNYREIGIFKSFYYVLLNYICTNGTAISSMNGNEYWPFRNLDDWHIFLEEQCPCPEDLSSDPKPDTGVEN
jgi:hypothetical protein